MRFTAKSNKTYGLIAVMAPCDKITNRAYKWKGHCKICKSTYTGSLKGKVVLEVVSSDRPKSAICPICNYPVIWYRNSKPHKEIK